MINTTSSQLEWKQVMKQKAADMSCKWVFINQRLTDFIFENLEDIDKGSELLEAINHLVLSDIQNKKNFSLK